MMKKEITQAIGHLHKAERASPNATRTFAKEVHQAIDILRKALQKQIGDGGDDKNP